jgi:hypothetical protein
LINHLTRLGVPHTFQGYLKSELAPQLDLDIAHMAGPIDPPGDCSDDTRGYDGQPNQSDRCKCLPHWASQGKHPCLPGLAAIAPRDYTKVNPSNLKE